MDKYGIQIKNFYNFNETGFIINVITASIIITRSNKHGKVKSVQFNNQK